MRLQTNIAGLFIGLLFVASSAMAQELRVMTSGMFTEAHLQLSRQFERDTHQKVVTVVTTMGTGEDTIPKRLQRREPVDVVIMSSPSFDALIKSGTILPDSRVDLARSGIGMAVRAGAPKPDISSAAALKQTLLNAKSIAYSASVSGTYLTTEIIPKFGIADQVLPKSRRADPERVGAVVARGDAEIGFQQLSELLPIKGIEVVGPLPPELQRISVVTAGIPAHAKNMEAARAYIKFLTSPQSSAEVTKSGLEMLPTAQSVGEPTARPVGARDLVPEGTNLRRSNEQRSRATAAGK